MSPTLIAVPLAMPIAAAGFDMDQTWRGSNHRNGLVRLAARPRHTLATAVGDGQNSRICVPQSTSGHIAAAAQNWAGMRASFRSISFTRREKRIRPTCT